MKFSTFEFGTCLSYHLKRTVSFWQNRARTSTGAQLQATFVLLRESSQKAVEFIYSPDIESHSGS